MGFLNKYPYTDFHELNLDWFLAEFKKVMDTTATLEQSVEQFRNFIDNLDLDITQEVHDQLVVLIDNGTIQALIEPLLDSFKNEVNGEIGAQNLRISGLEGRMDTFAQLPPGSTAGNAELLDIRVSRGGIVFSSAGNAVRQENQIVDNGKLNLLSLATAYKGYYTQTGVDPSYTQGYQDGVNWGFFVIPVKKGMVITLSGCTTTIGAWSAWLNSSNPSDFNSALVRTSETDGSYNCKTDWLALTMYNPSSVIDTSKVLFDVYPNLLKTNALLIQASNYQDFLPDVDNINESIVYKLNYAANDSNLPANLPFSTTPYGDIFVLVTYANTSSGANVGGQQFLYGRANDVWYRRKGSVWNAWEKLDSKGRLITVGASGCDYTAFVPAFIEACKTHDSRVFVKDGTYDLIDEFETYISATFFTNYNTAQQYAQGLLLQNGITVEMASGAKLVANYTGNNATVRSYWSPFVAHQGDFTLINMTLECKNTRYCIHDDQVVKNIGPARHYYLGCHFEIDNSTFIGSPNTYGCIGGGLDIATFVEIDSCYFKSLGAPGADIVNNPTLSAVSYHNSVLANAKSNVIIKNSYLEYGTIRFGKYGASTLVTDAMVVGCRCKAAPFDMYEDPGQYQNDNIRLMAWSNTIE